MLANLLRIIQHMQPKKKDPMDFKTLLDDKELLRETLPVLAMPNVDSDKFMAELEDLQPKWKEEKVDSYLFLLLPHLAIRAMHSLHVFVLLF